MNNLGGGTRWVTLCFSRTSWSHAAALIIKMNPLRQTKTSKNEKDKSDFSFLVKNRKTEPCTDGYHILTQTVKCQAFLILSTPVLEFLFLRDNG